LTIGFWCAKISGTESTGNHILRYKPVNLMIRYNYQSNGKINLLMEGKDAYYTIDLSQDIFTHILFTVNGETHKIYINGEEVNWTSISGDSTMDSNGFTHGTSSDKFEFFSNPDASTDFRGKIKNFRIYDRELSASEVEKLYNAQYISKRSITDSTDEYIIFKTNLNIIADFTNTTITNLTSWVTYGTSIFGDNFTYVLNTYQEGYGVWEGGSGIGWFKIVLPVNYNYIKVEYTNGDSAINTGVANLYIDSNPDSATPLRSILEHTSVVYEGYYNIGDILKIQEDYATIKDVKITLSQEKEYTINFPEETECEILLLDDTNYKHLETPLESLNGTYTVKVGTTESSISKSGYIKTTSGEVRTPELLSISGYASWDNHKAHAETNNGRLPYRDEIINLLNGDTSLNDQINPNVDSTTKDVWIPINDYVGAFIEIGNYPSHGTYTLKTPNGGEKYYEENVLTSAGTSISSSSIWGNNDVWVPNTNIFYVPYYSTDITGLTKTYSNKEVIIRYKTKKTSQTTITYDVIDYRIKLPESKDGYYNNHLNDLIVWYKFDNNPDTTLKNYGNNSNLNATIYNSGISSTYLTDNSNVELEIYKIKKVNQNKIDKIHIIDNTTIIKATSNINIDLLLIGGGGGGGLGLNKYNIGGGGGGGGEVKYIENFLIEEGYTYEFKIGKGGDINLIGETTEVYKYLTGTSNIELIYKCLGGGSYYERLLKSPEININNTVTNGLIAHYKFDGNLTDSSGNNNHLEVVVSGHTYPDGVYDEAVLFASDTTTELRTINNFQQINQNTSFSVSTWVKLN